MTINTSILKEHELDAILDWHARMGYNVECSFMPVRDNNHDILGWQITWFNDARRLEYWMCSKDSIKE